MLTRLHLIDGTTLTCELSHRAIEHLESWRLRAGPGRMGVRTVGGERHWLDPYEIETIDPAPHSSDVRGN